MKKRKKRPVKAGLKSAGGKSGGKRHATFQAWRYNDGKAHPVTRRQIDSDSAG